MSGSRDAKTFARSFSHLLKRAVQYSVHCYMEEAGKSGLTHRQFTGLSAADVHEGKSQTELVRITGIDRSTLTDLVARLMAQGYVQRRRTKEDARTNSIKLTPLGKKGVSLKLLNRSNNIIECCADLFNRGRQYSLRHSSLRHSSLSRRSSSRFRKG